MSTPSGRSAMLLGMMSYFFIFAALMGGMYLAIDTTAGERERGSLEPLLSLPVTRDQLIFGKIAATCVFMALSLMLSLTSFYVSLKFMPLEQLGMTPNFGPGVVLAAFAIFAAVHPARRRADDAGCVVYKELSRGANVAQRRPDCADDADSHRQHPDAAAALEFMFIPCLSQHLLLVDMVKNEPINGLHVAISVISTLVIGIVADLGMCAAVSEGGPARLEYRPCLCSPNCGDATSSRSLCSMQLRAGCSSGSSATWSATLACQPGSATISSCCWRSASRSR